MRDTSVVAPRSTRDRRSAPASRGTYAFYSTLFSYRKSLSRIPISLDLFSSERIEVREKERIRENGGVQGVRGFDFDRSEGSWRREGVGRQGMKGKRRVSVARSLSTTCER